MLLHIGERAAYDTGHIPGARYVDYSDEISVSDHSGKGLMLEMLPAEELRGRLSALGIPTIRGWSSTTARTGCRPRPG